MDTTKNGGKAAVAGVGPARADENRDIGGRDLRRCVVHRELEIKDRRLMDA